MPTTTCGCEAEWNNFRSYLLIQHRVSLIVGCMSNEDAALRREVIVTPVL